jgi:NAD(P)-dependent dehydrogenase (short-subunit alcohol dehydrogenase family)
MSTMLTALGRAAEPDELVDVVLYMCSDSAGFITGVNIVADGGHLCLPPPYGI